MIRPKYRRKLYNQIGSQSTAERFSEISTSPLSIPSLMRCLNELHFS